MKFALLLSLIFIQQTLTHQKIVNSNKCDEGKLLGMDAKLDRILHENELLNQKLDKLKKIIKNHTIPNPPSDHLIEVPANKSKNLPASCAEAFQQGGHKSGIHQIYLPDSKLEPFYVYCLADPENPEAPWTIIQRRQDGSIDFYRKWSSYQNGFGNMEGEFFIGLDKLHALTKSTLHELWIQMEDFEKQTRSANYSSFAIGDNSEAYALNLLGSFKGEVGDSFTIHAGQKFTTKDVDNDNRNNQNCAVQFTGGWWYNDCHDSNLNGRYLKGKTNDLGKGITWKSWHGTKYSLKYVHMAIRPEQKN